MTSGATARDDAVSVERQQQRAYLPHRASLVHYKVNTTTNTNVDGNKPSSRQKKKRDDTEVAEDDDDFMMRIVHGSCQGVFRGGDGSLCQIPSCQMPEHLDLLMV